MKRDSKNKLLFGVCAGLAKGIGLDPLWVRLLLVFLFLNFGVGLLLYIILALLMPAENGD